MKVVLAEKPSVGKNIAQVLGATSTGDGYCYGNDYYVTWAFGHLVELKQANSYIDNPWLLSNLPIFPTPFKLQVKQDPGAIKQFNIIKGLFLKADQIINATDAAREGELIFRYICELIELPPLTNIKRLWISSLTTEAIKKGFDNLIPNEKLDALYFAGKGRSEADWLVGINGTIALTRVSKLSNRISLGRVQTPTFSMVVKRFLEHRNFKPTPYYVTELLLENQNIEFIAQNEHHFQNKQDAQKLIDATKKTITCTHTDLKARTEKPPLLFDLTALQVVANQSYGMTAQQTLTATQSLYEKHKAVTYPRTDSRYLTNDMKDDVKKMITTFMKFDLYKNFIGQAIDLEKLPLAPFKDNKVTDHHAIIPTPIKNLDLLLNALNTNEKKIYILIYTNFLACFSKVCKKTITTYDFGYNEIPTVKFSAKGSVINQAGWRLFPIFTNEDSVLPKLEQGQDVTIVKKFNLTRKTSPPALLNESSLLKMMEGCGKEFDKDDELPLEVKAMGIGRPATRASIIERIIEVGYVQRQKKHIIPTELGLLIYKHIKDFAVASVKLTGKWEAQLNAIEESESEAIKRYQKFIENVKTNFSEQTLPNILSLENVFKTKEFQCPKCKAEKLSNQGRVYKCAACEFIIWKTYFGKDISEQMLSQLFQNKKIALTKLKGKNKAFDGVIFWNQQELKIQHEFLNPVTDVLCPVCKKGTLKKMKGFFSCTEYTNGCKFTISTTLFNKKFTDAAVLDFIKNKQTKTIKGFKSKAGKSFNAVLKLNTEGKIDLEFQ